MTHLLADLDAYARPFTQYVIDQKCHDILFHTFQFSDFFNQGCGNQLLSKGLGYAIVAGSMMVKVPQILKMTSSKSSEGISSTSNFLDLFMVGATLGYGFLKDLPFASYGDALFVYAQTAIILVLIPFYKNNNLLMFLFLAAAGAAGYAISQKLISVEVITMALKMNIPLTFISRGIQIITNFGNKSTGQLSGITFFMSFAGCGSRVFTSLVDAKDNLMAVSFAVAFILNGVIWAQILYYGKQVGAGKKKAE